MTEQRETGQKEKVHRVRLRQPEESRLFRRTFGAGRPEERRLEPTLLQRSYHTAALSEKQEDSGNYLPAANPPTLAPIDFSRIPASTTGPVGGQFLARASLHQGSLIQRSPISDAVEKVWKDTSDKNAVLKRLSEDDAHQAKADADLAAALKRIFPDANDQWLAQKVLERKLGDTTGIAAKGIPSSPIQVFFFQGKSNERALVIAGVHGTERQGMEVAQMLIKDLQTQQPFFTVIIVPSLFPDNAALGKFGTREGDTQTNRNFPEGGKSLAEASKDKAGNPLDANKKKILPENIMLMELMERFQPSRIISIHGTWDASKAGVFMDKHSVSPAMQQKIKADAKAIVQMIVSILGIPSDPAMQKTLEDNLAKMLLDEAQKEAGQQTDMDKLLSIATAQAIQDHTKGLTTLQKRQFADKAAKDMKKFPAVAGNRLDLGKGKENVTWGGGTAEGVSLGSYAPGRGMSVFTVEPAINRNAADYPDKLDEGISKAERQLELQSYADAVRTILLGDPSAVKKP